MSDSRVLLASVAIAVFVGGAAAQAQPSTSMPTREFVQAAQASDRYEIDSAQVALIEGQDPRLRSYAQAMIQAHTRTTEALRQASLASGITPPPIGLDGDGQKFLGQLQSLRGSDFDKAYARQQVLAHRSALVVEQDYAATGSDSSVRQAAQAAVPIIQQHLEMVQRMQPADSQ